MSDLPEAFFDLDDVRRMVTKWAVDCGKRVKARRGELGWDRRQLAAMTGTTEATVHRIEAGTLNPRDHLKLVFAATLQVEVAELWPYPLRADVYAGTAA